MSISDKFCVFNAQQKIKNTLSRLGYEKYFNSCGVAGAVNGLNYIDAPDYLYCAKLIS